MNPGFLSRFIVATGLVGVFVFGRIAFPSDYDDLAFEQFADISLVGPALTGRDAAALADLALQLAKGEQVLLRQHKSGLTAKVLLQTAATVAANEQDTTTLERLRKAAALLQDEDLATQLAALEKTGGASRASDPDLTVSLDTVNLDTAIRIRCFVDVIQEAELTGDRELLDEMDAQLRDSGDLGDAQRCALTRLVQSARETMPADSTTAANALARLAAQSRASFPCTKCSTLGYYMTTEMRGAGVFKTKVPVRKRCDRCGGDGYISTKPLEDNLKKEQADRERRAREIAESLPWELGIVQITTSGGIYLNGSKTNYTAKRGRIGTGEYALYYNRLLKFPKGVDAWYQWYRLDRETMTRKRKLATR